MDERRIYLELTANEAFLLSLLLTEFRNESLGRDELGDALSQSIARLCANLLPMLPQTTGCQA